MAGRLNIDTTHGHYAEAIFDHSTRERWTPEQKLEFITNLVHHETFVTELTEVEEFITNIFSSVTYINQIKGQPGGVPALDGNGKVPKGQIHPDYIDNPMTGAGDLVIGGAGTPVGYTKLTGPGVSGLAITPVTGNQTQAYDGDLTPAFQTGIVGSGSYPTYDFSGVAGYPFAIGKFQHYQWPGIEQARMDEFRAEVSDDGVAWTTVYHWTLGDYTNTGEIVIPVPIPARYFRLVPLSPVNPAFTTSWTHPEFSVWKVELDDDLGAATRLPFVNGRLMRGVGGLPAWIAPSDAIADLDQDISASPTEAQVQAISDKVDLILAALREMGVIAEA